MFLEPVEQDMNIAFDVAYPLSGIKQSYAFKFDISFSKGNNFCELDFKELFFQNNYDMRNFKVILLIILSSNPCTYRNRGIVPFPGHFHLWYIETLSFVVHSGSYNKNLILDFSVIQTKMKLQMQ